MARETIEEQTAVLESERDYLRSDIKKINKLASVKAQGSSGAETNFQDIAKLQDQLKYVMTQLSVNYRILGL